MESGNTEEGLEPSVAQKERKEGGIRGGQIERDRARMRESVPLWKREGIQSGGKEFSSLGGRTPVTNDQETPGDEAQVKKMEE
jgi:hypothetical protein